MINIEEMSFKNEYYGVCKIIPLKNPDVLKSVLISSALLSQKKAPYVHLEQLLRETSLNQERYGLGVYQIHARGVFLGFSGFFFNREKTNISPDIFIYISPIHQKKEVGENLMSFMIELAFNKLKDCHELTAGLLLQANSMEISLERYGFSQKQSIGNKINKQLYFLTRSDRGLCQLSEIIKRERSNLLFNTNDISKDFTERVMRLWYLYFNTRGINLATSGVEDCIIKMEDIWDNPRLKIFNMYISDDDSSLKPELIRKFLVEDGAISEKSDLSHLAVSFSFGAHEGFTRVSRNIYRRNFNDGVFFPMGSHSLFMLALMEMKPLPYNVHLVEVSFNEKINLIYLKKESELNPKSRTLYLDLKTTAGIIYTENEIKEIIAFCKENGLFLIVDATHLNMQFDSMMSFPDVFFLSQLLNFTDFAVLYTGSKTYGLERGRVGFIVFDDRSKSISLDKLDSDFSRIYGTPNDLPMEVARALLNMPLTKRQEFLKKQTDIHRYNMNLMIAYIEGVESKKIDDDLRERVTWEITDEYQSGIKGLKVVHKPEAGIHLKVDMSELSNMYFYNIRMMNSEIFSYTLHKVANVVVLHSYQIMDPSGFVIKLTFSVENNIHLGMRALYNFVVGLKNFPSENRFMKTIDKAEALILEEKNKTENKISPAPMPKTNSNQFLSKL